MLQWRSVLMPLPAMTKTVPATRAVTLAMTVLVTMTAHASPNDYPVKGFDVSHHQGLIDWSKISPQQYQFVYLKATEGGDFNDKKFQDNWLAARERGLKVGAYHFFSMCRDGKIQAQHFIQTVPNKSNALPPVMDLEYDTACIDRMGKDKLLQQIKVMHDQLSRHYGKQPIFYTTPNFYHIVLKGSFPHTPIWVREYKKPIDLNGRNWMIWQHSNQGKINGISTTVDLNVFQGTRQDWLNYLKSQHVQ